MTPVVLVAGPPCGGKSTYVAEHATPDDLVLDFDELRQQVGGDRYTTDPQVTKQAHALWTAGLSTPAPRRWVIWSAPRRQQRGSFRTQYAATVVVAMASQQECHERVLAERPAIWLDYLRSWYRLWEPSRSGHETIVWTGRRDTQP